MESEKELWVLTQVLRWEGDGKADAAGARFGIDPRFHPEVDVAHLTREGALAWYHQHVWEKWRLAELDAPRALVLADYFTNSGQGPARYARLDHPDAYDILLDRWAYLVSLAHGDVSKDPEKLAEWKGAFLGWMVRLRENLVAVRRWEKEHPAEQEQGDRVMFSGSWRTTLAGILLAFGLIFGEVGKLLDNDPETVANWQTVIGAVIAAGASIGLGGSARDDVVSSAKLGVK